MSLLQYAPMESSVDASFWTELARLKLEELGLSTAPRSITGFLSLARSNVASPLQLTSASLAKSEVRRARRCARDPTTSQDSPRRTALSGRRRAGLPLRRLRRAGHAGAGEHHRGVPDSR